MGQSIFNSGIINEENNIPVKPKSKADPEMIKGAIYALGGKITREDVMYMVNDGFLSTNDARQIVTAMEAPLIKVDKNMKQLAMHRHACIVLAKNNNDPMYRSLVDNFIERDKIFEKLDVKYGKEARVNQNQLIQQANNEIRTESVKNKFRELN